MKRIPVIIFLSVFCISTFSQGTAEKLSGILNETASSIPADQVYIHTDRNIYNPGDTIRFQAYIRDRRTGIFETGSISLYVLLTDALNRTIDSSRFRITNSTSPGWLSVPDSAKSGDCNLIAFTGTMMNYDPGYAFRAPLKIVNPRTSGKQGQGIQNPEETAPLKIEADLQSLNINFLPEGGTFIAGIKQRIAINAVTSAGTGYKAAGRIVNQKGDFICSFTTGEFGQGLAELTPVPGDHYSAVLSGNEFSELNWKLPAPDSSGIALRADITDKAVISIQISAVKSIRKSYLLALIMNNSLVYAGAIRIDSLIRLKISTEELPVGTAEVIVFDDQLRPVAERLVFVNHNKNPKTEAGGPSSRKKGDETEISINVRDNIGKNITAVLSVSVIDSASGYCNKFPSGNIESELLYDKTFYDNLPDKIKYSGISNLDKNSLDLLLMTYGWRKFKPKDPYDTTVVRQILGYDYLMIRETGQVRKTPREINLVAIEGAGSFTLIPGAAREAILRYDTLGSNVRQIMIMPDKKMTVNNDPLTIEFPENKPYSGSVKHYKNLRLNTGPEISFYRNPVRDFGGDTIVKIGEVLIKGAQPPTEKVPNKYQIQYQYTNPVTLTAEDFKTVTYFEDILVRLHPFWINTKEKKVYITMGRSGRYSPPALIVVDDNPLWGTTISRNGRGESDYVSIADMLASNISSVTMIRGVQGFPLYGEQALGGVIFVTTNGKAMMDGTYKEVRPWMPSANNNLAKPIRIFRSEIEFYVPTKEQVQLIPEYHNRPTLYWNNELIIDGSGPVKINYPNNLKTGTVIVNINGVTFDNVPFSSTTKYSVK